MFVKNRSRWVLAGGDLVVLALIVIAGFAFHGELEPGDLYRVFAFYTPMAVGWILIGRQSGVYEPGNITRISQLWRPVWVMALLSPLSATLRSVLLQAPNVVVIFVMVTFATGAAGMVVWRLLYGMFARRNAVLLPASG